MSIIFLYLLPFGIDDFTESALLPEPWSIYIYVCSSGASHIREVAQTPNLPVSRFRYQSSFTKRASCRQNTVHLVYKSEMLYCRFPSRWSLLFFILYFQQLNSLLYLLADRSKPDSERRETFGPLIPAYLPLIGDSRYINYRNYSAHCKKPHNGKKCNCSSVPYMATSRLTCNISICRAVWSWLDEVLLN